MMTSFEISKKTDQIQITKTTVRDGDPVAVRWSKTPDPNGWYHFPHQLNYVAGDDDLTVTGGGYFKIHGSWSLPSDADTIAGMFASMMWRTAQEAEEEVLRRGAQTTQTYKWLLDGCRKSLKMMTYP